MHVGLYLQMVKTTEQELAEAFKTVADHHRQEPDLEQICTILSSWSHAKARSTDRFIHKYGRERDREPQRLYSDLFQGPRRGGLALLRDLHDLWLMTTEAQIAWTLLGQAAQALRDKDFVQTCAYHKEQTHRQTSWLPQTLVAA